MNEISSIYIIDPTGATIFSYESHIQGLSNASLALLSHFLTALKSIAKNLKDDEIKRVEISNNTFFLNREKKTNFLFIVKSNRNTTYDLIEPILEQIKVKFIEKFTGDNVLFVDDKIELLNLFQEDIKKMLKQKTNIENFMGSF
jgi:outer membrane protein OmpA-like peptidoglycan-associated protein